jgi:hypothetical protein
MAPRCSMCDKAVYSSGLCYSHYQTVRPDMQKRITALERELAEVKIALLNATDPHRIAEE